MWAKHEPRAAVLAFSHQLHVPVASYNGILRKLFAYFNAVLLPLYLLPECATHLYQQYPSIPSMLVNTEQCSSHTHRQDIIGAMEAQSETAVTIVGFRKLERPAATEKTLWGIDRHLLSLVVLDFDYDTQGRQRMREVEGWARGRAEEVRLLRVTKRQAFLQTYKQAMRSQLKTYFLTCLSIEQLSKQPLQAYYQQHSTATMPLKQVEKMAEVNLQRIGFIILRQKLENIDSRSYFHPNVALITSEVPLVLHLLQENLKIMVKLRPLDSSSSVNSDEAVQLGQELSVVGMRLSVFESEKSQRAGQEQEALKLLNDTPGVGTYNIQASRI